MLSLKTELKIVTPLQNILKKHITTADFKTKTYEVVNGDIAVNKNTFKIGIFIVTRRFTISKSNENNQICKNQTTANLA